MWLAIDFGTTNTSAAVYDGQQLIHIPLDAQNSNPHNLRSIIYINRAQQVRLGVNAIQTFLREDTGRETLMEETVVGTIENTVAPQEGDEPITIIYDVVINEDIAMRGRLIQSIKTALRSSSYEGTHFFGKFYTIEELIALLLRHVRAQAEKYLGQKLERVIIGRPVTFSNDAEIDRIAEDRIRTAAQMAGFTDILFVPEPLAAAAFYLEKPPVDETIFVFDFGGGTLDMTVLRSTAGGERQILATTGILVGGDDLDSAIMRGKVAASFGATSHIDATFDGRPIPFPEHLAEQLNHWQTIPVLTRPHNQEIIQRALLYGDNHEAFEALEILAQKNYGFALFQKIEQSKCALSEQLCAAIDLQMESKHIHVDLSREEFNRMIADEKYQVRQGIREVISASGLKADQIDVVVATGGSSSIPAFRALLATELPQAKVVVSDLFGSIVGGLAISAHQLQPVG